MASFQVKLGEKWANYDKDEDKVLKRAFQAGFPNARFSLRGQKYQYDFRRMVQKNVETGKERQIRAPHKWTQPAKPLIPKGRSTTVKVPAGPGGKPPNFVKLPHPDQKGAFFDVEIPAAAKVGQILLVPVPDLPAGGLPVEPPMPSPSAPPADSPTAAAGSGSAAGAGTGEKKSGGGGWSTGGKVAAGVAGTAAVGGLVVGGVLLGEHVADVGWDAAGADIAGAAGDAGDAIVGAAETAGDAIAGAAEDAGEWISGAAEDAGDFIMDLF